MGEVIEERKQHQYISSALRCECVVREDVKKMKRGFWCLLIAGCLVFFSGSAWALLYDFEDDGQADDWEVLDGEAKIEDGMYILNNTTSSSGIAVIGDMTWTDCTIKCKAMLMEGSADNIGLVWRTGANNLFYVISIRMDQRTGYCGCVNGVWMNGGSPIIPMPFVTEVDQEYELELIVEGNKFQFFIDGEDMGEWEDDQLETGRIGLRVWSAIMAVDEFEINGPGIPRTAVDSQGKLAATWAGIRAE